MLKVFKTKHLPQQHLKYSATPPAQNAFFATQILGGHVTSPNQGLSSNGQGRQKRESLGTSLENKFSDFVR